MISEKQKYILITLFFITLITIFSLRVSVKYKMSLFLLAVLLCFFQPLYLVPLVISLVIIYLITSKTKKKTIENFEDSPESFLDMLDNLNDNNLGKLNTYLKELPTLIPEDFNTKPYLNQTTFLTEIGKVYFFSLEKPSDFRLALRLNYHFRTVSDLQDKLKFSDIFTGPDNLDDMYRDTLVPDKILQNEPLKKLGLLVYNSKYIAVSKFFLKVISDLGLYAIVNNKYELENSEELNKKIYELVIHIFFQIYQEEGKFNFNTYRSEPRINLMDFWMKWVALPESISSPVVLKLEEIQNYKLVSSNSYFPADISELMGSTFQSDLEENLEENLNILLDRVEEHFDELSLLDMKFYRITDRKSRKLLEIQIKENYFLLLITTGYFDSIIKLDRVDYLKLYNEKSETFQFQVQNEIKIRQNYNFSSPNDVFHDLFFFYHGLRVEDTQFIRNFIYPEPEIAELVPGPTDLAEDINPVYAFQQGNYELELDDYLKDTQRKEKQEEAITKYYDFLKKENYQKLDTLNQLAQAQKTQEKYEKLTFNYLIDNFGKEVYQIIDELVVVIGKFYRDENLEELKQLTTSSLHNPSFQEYFDNHSPGPSPGPSSSQMSKLDKYILFIKVILDILLQKNRIVYVGFIFILIALTIYFVDSSSGYREPKPSFLDFLKF